MILAPPWLQYKEKTHLMDHPLLEQKNLSPAQAQNPRLLSLGECISLKYTVIHENMYERGLFYGQKTGYLPTY